MILEKINTLREESKKGVSIPKEHYLIVKDFIFNQLEKEKVVTLLFLLEQAEACLKDELGANTNWTLLAVKRDLEIRRIIKIGYSQRRVQYVIFNKKSDYKYLQSKVSRINDL